MFMHKEQERPTKCKRINCTQSSNVSPFRYDEILNDVDYADVDTANIVQL